MKNKILLFASLMLTLASCSKNDDPVVVPPTSTPIDTTGDNIVTTFMNLGSTNSWTYDTTKVVVLPLPSANTNGSDVLNVNGDFIANGFNYKIMTASSSSPIGGTINGFYCNQLKDNKLRIDGSSVKMSGKFKFTIGTNDLEFPVNDFVIFKENAVLGTNLGTPATGSTNFFVALTPTANLPVVVNYSIKAIAGGNAPDITYLTNTYKNIIKVTLYISIDATTSSGAGTIQIFSSTPQDVIISTQYYSKGIGLVKAETAIKYDLNPSISALSTAIPPKGEQNIVDFLKNKSF